MALSSADPVDAVDVRTGDTCIEESCPVARAVAVLDGKWTLLVVRDLAQGPRRFGELRSSLVGISPKTLTDRLRELEAGGLVEREYFPQIPPKVEYSLSDLGRHLQPVLDSLAAFGQLLPAEADAEA